MNVYVTPSLRHALVQNSSWEVVQTTVGVHIYSACTIILFVYARMSTPTGYESLSALRLCMNLHMLQILWSK